MTERIVVIPETGEGAGARDAEHACGLLRWMAERFGHDFELVERPLTPSTWRDTVEVCRQASAVLTSIPAHDGSAPGGAAADLSRLRRELSLFASVSAIQRFAQAGASTPVRAHPHGVDDVLVVSLREEGWDEGPLSRALSPGDEPSEAREDLSLATSRLAFGLARRRWGQLTAVNLAGHVTEQPPPLWPRLATVAGEFPGIFLERTFSQDLALHRSGGPMRWDVVLAPAPVADELLHREALLTGLLGVHPSACLGTGRRGLYQPLHRPVADPRRSSSLHSAGVILAAAMLMRHSLGLEREASLVEAAVARALADWAGARRGSPRWEMPLHEGIQAHLGGESHYSQAV
ncbi:isocitrate/isopropylmalate family dehydrogenase [Myxococcus stipitatus]|uniref:isocitrate/isopropylmalate family dehydrogenase n=1 Tax=Myxococcus stipitatus TaxID=83455 RepID=UPI0030D5D8EB